MLNAAANILIIAYRLFSWHLFHQAAQIFWETYPERQKWNKSTLWARENWARGTMTETPWIVIVQETSIPEARQSQRSKRKTVTATWARARTAHSLSIQPKSKFREQTDRNLHILPPSIHWKGATKSGLKTSTTSGKNRKNTVQYTLSTVSHMSGPADEGSLQYPRPWRNFR